MSADAARDVARQMAEAAADWLSILEKEQRAKASFDFTDQRERTDWAYFPRNHSGLPLLEMTPRQQKLAHVLLSSALSLPAYAKVNAIIALESVLNLIEQRRADAVRDPGRYFLSLFGEPGGDPWGWRFEGHHVCLNFTIARGEVISPTPVFLGANPAEVAHGGHAASRPCGEEEELARELVLSFNKDQRAAAVLCERAPPDIVVANAATVPESAVPGEMAAFPPRMGSRIQARVDAMTQEDKDSLRLDRDSPRGLSWVEMDEVHRTMLSTLVDAYVERLPGPLAALEKARVEQAGLDALYFAWAGEFERRRPHYYRVHGSELIIEYDNTQDDANHIHAVWRHPRNDFGGDILRRHLAAAH
jgi:hypothetical protein